MSDDPSETTGVTLTIGLPNFGGYTGGSWTRLLELARAAEDAGFDRLVVNDHVVMGPNTDAYVWGRFPVPPDAPWLEPMTTLTAIAGVTSAIRLATGVLIAPLRSAVLLAKTAATLDVLSGGRLDLGVGVGWQREEYEASGLPFEQRGQLLDDQLGALRVLWRDLPAQYDSPTVSFVETYCAPQPAQQRLPLWISGTLNERNLRRITAHGDAWIPIMGATPEQIGEGVERIKAATDRAIAVQAPVKDASDASAINDLLARGVTDLYVNVAALARNHEDAPTAMSTTVRQLKEAVS